MLASVRQFQYNHIKSINFNFKETEMDFRLQQMQQPVLQFLVANLQPLRPECCPDNIVRSILNPPDHITARFPQQRG